VFLEDLDILFDRIKDMKQDEIPIEIQQQINNISASAGNISTVGYIEQTLTDTSSTQFGTNAYNKLLLSTTSLYNSAFGGNTLYNNTTGNFNTAVGHSAGFANTTGGLMTAIGQQALAKNTSGNYNTAVGFVSSITLVLVSDVLALFDQSVTVTLYV
jgi:hypothetical protein